MPSSPVIRIVEHLRKTVLRDEDTLSDGQLLDRFLETRDEAAFAALVRRHGPMVWGVCRRIVGQAMDAEDAFQAAFLILVRKAASVKPRAALGNWLYGVACRAALKARADSYRVRANEKQVTSMPERAKEPRDDPEALQKLLDQELSALPDKYRLPVVLCDLEGRTRKEVAAQLKIPEGTLSSRLATAHQMLSKRLARHGLAVSGASLAALLAQNTASACVPASVVSTTIKTATIVAAGNGVAAGVVSTKVAALTKGVLKTMFLTKLKLLGVTLTIAVLACFGIVGAIQMYAGERVAASERDPIRSNGAEDEPQPKKPPKSDDDLARLQGTWKVVSVGVNGKALKLNVKSSRITFKKAEAIGESENNDGTKTVDKITIRIDATKSPKEITLRFGGRGEIQSIYRFDKDKLVICNLGKNADTNRPQGFTPQDSGAEDVLLVTQVYEREPPAVPMPDEPAVQEIKEPTTELEELHGTWALMETHKHGQKVAASDIAIEPHKLTIDAHRKSKTPRATRTLNPVCAVDFHVNGSNEGGHCEVNTATNPKELTLTWLGVRQWICIYMMEGDTLTICFNPKDNIRPDEFRTAADSDRMLFVYQRVKGNQKGKGASREDEVRDIADRFLKATLAGETEKACGLAAPAISDQQLARFKGLAKTLPIAYLDVTGDSAPTSGGNNAGRALVMTDEIEITDGRGKKKGRIVLDLLKDDERLKTKGWLAWEIHIIDEASIEKAKKFIDRSQSK